MTVSNDIAAGARRAEELLPNPPKHLTSASYRAMVAGWMLAIAFVAAGFIWFGISSWHEPAQSITSLWFGIFLILMSVARIVRKELENGGQ